MISDNIKRLRENMGLSQAALARKLGVTRASVNAWEMELSSPTAAYLVEMARLFHTTTMLYISYPVSWILTTLVHLACLLVVRHKMNENLKAAAQR